MSKPVAPAADVQSKANGRAFNAWSRSYDNQANPLIMLEQRYLEKLLPVISGRDVLDAGCGSGRWLRYLAARHPATLRGIDTSPAMLKVASRNRIAGAELYRCSCDATPFVASSFDLILASFVVSYVADLNAMAEEFTRIARDQCDLIISDMHPETQQRLHWTRSFRSRGGEVRLDSIPRDPAEIVAAFAHHGWRLVSIIEPEFGNPEREVFASAGKPHRFSEAAGSPAVCILQFRKLGVQYSGHTQIDGVVLRGARCAFGLEESVPASLHIDRGHLDRLISPRFPNSEVSAASQQIDLAGYVVMPGLVNAHDHLEFALFPHLGGKTYANASEWAEDIHDRFARTIGMHKRIPLRTRFWWGGLRNLLCGVTSVCHHNPPHPELERNDFPVRVVRDYGWAHSLAFDKQIRTAHTASLPGRAFVVHACEGTDERARLEVAELDRLGVLDCNTVLVHGLALDREGAALMRLRGSSLVICPSSNHFLFSKVPDAHVLDSIDTVALGSDSPLTARGDLLDELRFSMDFCRIAPAQAWRMITEIPARLLRLPGSTGLLQSGGAADLIAIRDTHGWGPERLRSMTTEDIELVIIGGRVHLASAAILQRLPLNMTSGLEPLSVDGMVRWLRAPVQHLLDEAEAILGRGHVRLGHKRVRALTATEIEHE